jgi:aminopeptidase N
MEYPLVNLLGIELYTRFQNNIEILVSHEVAHQWWYQIVHNDPVNTPWLDEALAEYSVKLYFEKLYGESEAALLQMQRWQTPLNLLIARDEDVLINRPVAHFDNSTQYETVVYAKGALLYDHIHGVLGDRRFKRFLAEYLDAHRWGIVDTDDWRAAIAALQLPELDNLFREWVGEAARPPSPTVTPTPASED